MENMTKPYKCPWNIAQSIGVHLFSIKAFKSLTCVPENFLGFFGTVPI